MGTNKLINRGNHLRLTSPFIQLNCQFDPEKLQAEVAQLPATAWRGHPQGFDGNSAVTLIARGGDAIDDSTYGPMQATEWLDQLPYIRTIMASLQAPLGRSRLMRIAGASQVPSHTDLDYYWQRRMRIHVPIITHNGVRFECADEAVHMAAGQAWVFDTTQLHRVLNPQDSERIHLVIDTVGSDHLFGLLDGQTQSPVNHQAESVDNLSLPFESHNRPTVMHPSEQREILAELLDMLTTEHHAALIEKITSTIQPILHDWQAKWAIHGPNQSGLKQYQNLQQQLTKAASTCGAGKQFRGAPVEHWLRHWLADPALDEEAFGSINPPTANQTTTTDQSQQQDSETPSYASQYTDSLPALIAHLGGTLVATTYASNRLVLLRSEGAELNTHFKDYPGPMGLAYDGNRLALGVQNSIWQFRSQPDLTKALQPQCDAVYVPTQRHMTGDIRVHELGWSKDELWFVNTRFSCLATLDDEHSFVPRWHPHFIDKLNAEDACHLNGMAMRDGQPAWVSALGVSDQPGGWRENKREGGVVIDVASGEIATAGLCMPHSPRWHRDALWILDSGRGELCQVDVHSGERQTVVRLPGFTRGLAMIDRYAFVGCSRVREKAWFGGLPVLEEEQPPECGIWAVDLITGQIIAWLKFAEGIDEIFDLMWLPQQRWPEILEPDEATARNGFALPAEKLPQFR